MFDKLIAYLQKREWKYIENEDQSMISFNLSGTNGVFQCSAYDQRDKNRFIFFTYCISTCPEDIRIRMAELLMRLNNTIFFGNFELNFETGQIKFKTSIFYENLELTETAIDSLIIGNVFMMDDCTPAIMKLIYGNLSPLEAFNLRMEQQRFQIEN